jgi:dipeptide/tripeptide permease
MSNVKSIDSHAPDPPDAATRKSVLWNVAAFILVTEFCERLAYYGFAGSLVLFFQVRKLVYLRKLKAFFISFISFFFI